MGKIYFLIFFGSLIWMLHSDQTRIVTVHLCESDELTTYVNRNAPPKLLKLGECRTEEMSKGEYYHLRMVIRNSK